MTDEYTLLSTFASLPRTTRGLPIVLGATPDGRSFIYCNGNSVFTRNVENPSECDTYTEHATLTSVAKCSPSGYYIASGDQSGKVRVWDTTQKTHILKAEYPVISGPIRDIAWSDDSKRLAVVGEGRERFGHVMLFDTGTSNGNLSGQSRSMSSIDFRNVRPYRLISGSEDNTVAIFEGPPFKFKALFHEHNRFVHCVRYSPDGSIFASAGADGKIVLYEGSEGTVQGQLIDEQCKGAAHSGGVFALSWSPDGTRILSASGDKTCKIWDTASKQLQTTFTFGSAIEDQQLSCLWLKDALLSVNLAGFVHYLNPSKPSQPTRIIKGHNKPITALALSTDKQYIFTGDFEGNITRWNATSGESERVTPSVHKSQLSGMAVSTSGTLISVAWDDTIAFTGNILDASIDNVRSNSTKLSSQPRGISISNDGELAAVACQRSVFVFTNGRQSTAISISYESTSIALHPNRHLIAVGGQDNKTHVYDVGSGGNDAKLLKELAHSGVVTAVSWSPDGQLLAATDTARKVSLYRLDADYTNATDKEWTFHTARVNCLAWSDNGRYLLTGSLDTNLIVWDAQHSGEHPIIVRGAHSMSPVNGVAWLSSNRVVSVGQDSNIKSWQIKLQ